MDTSVVVAITLVAFLLCVSLEMPIALGVSMAGVLGIILLEDVNRASSVLAAVPFTTTAKYGLFVIPMYILLGALIANAGIGTRIYSAVNRVVGRLPGGLAATAVAATAMFSGISGSTAADVAAFGRISVDEMSRHGYRKAYAAAVVSAAGTFAVLIPPSIVLVIYGILANVSIAAMIVAGLVPGVLSALALMVFVVVREIVRGRGDGSVSNAASTATSTTTETPRKLASLTDDAVSVFYALVLFGVVVGGLYGGVFTATEAGAVGAFVALIIAVISRKFREKPLTSVLKSSFRETADVTSMIFLLLVGGAIFTYFIASAGVPRSVTTWVLDLPVPPLAVVGLFLLALLALGMFLDGLSIMLLVVPIAAPVVMELGFDGVWFGILVIKMVEIGLITPPVGINVFIASSVADVPATSIFRFVLPFVILDLTITALFFIFPEIVLWLPRSAGLM